MARYSISAFASSTCLPPVGMPRTAVRPGRPHIGPFGSAEDGRGHQIFVVVLGPQVDTAGVGDKDGLPALVGVVVARAIPGRHTGREQALACTRPSPTEDVLSSASDLIVQVLPADRRPAAERLHDADHGVAVADVGERKPMPYVFGGFSALADQSLTSCQVFGAASSPAFFQDVVAPEEQVAVPSQTGSPVRVPPRIFGSVAVSTGLSQPPCALPILAYRSSSGRSFFWCGEQQEQVEAHIERVGHGARLDRRRDFLVGLVLVDHHDVDLDLVLLAPVLDRSGPDRLLASSEKIRPPQ